MSVDYRKFNAEWEASNPGEPTYTETGEDSATSIQRLNNNEDANEDVLRRPIEQLRRRTRHLQVAHNLLNAQGVFKQGQILDTQGATVLWNGLTNGVPAKEGVFELSSSVFISHPMYPDTVYEVPSTIIGNETTGFFNNEANRLKEEGDSLWVTFGDVVNDSTERDTAARAPGVVTVTQAQLRKGPTWVMIRETGTTLAGLGIIPGSDLLRIYPDPVGSPSTVLKRTIRNIFQDTDGNWFVEVAPDTPLWDTTLPASPIPSSAATTKRSRVSNGAEYDIVDVTETTTRIAQRNFASYHSNLEWFGAGREDLLQAFGTTLDDYREHEWANAFPLAVVANGNLVFPLAGAAGIPSGTLQQSPTGFMRTAIADTVNATHIFANQQTFQRGSGTTLMDLRTDSPGLGTGAGSHQVSIEESHPDGNVSSPVFWISPSRPARLRFSGSGDGYTNPFAELVEQGMYTAGGAYQGKETSLRLRRLAEGSYGAPSVYGNTYNELTASQLPYILSVDNAKMYQRKLAFQTERSAVAALGPADHGIAVGAFIPIGTAGLYETVRGKHDLLIEGTLGFRNIYPVQIDSVTTTQPAGLPNAKSSQTIRFKAAVRLTPDSTPTNPMGASVLTADSKVLVYTTLRDALVASGSPSPLVDSFTQETVIEHSTADTLTVGPANSRRSYPVTPLTSTTVFSALFKTDLSEYTAGVTQTSTKGHSQIDLRLVAVPVYDVGSNEHRVELYLQWDMHNEEVDAVELDYLTKNMYIQDFRNAFTASNPSGVDPTLVCDLQIQHTPRWDAPF